MTSGTLSSSPILPLAAPRSAPEIVDIAINLVRRHYPTFLTVTAIALTPMLLLTPVSASLPQLVISIASLICTGYAEACLMIGIAAVYRGETLPSAGEQLRAGRRIAGRVIRITVARNIATAIGLVFLIIPGLLLYAHFLLGAPVAALEDLKVGPALDRGRALAKGEHWRIVLVAGLSAVIYVLLWFGISIVVALLTRSEAFAYLVGTMVEILLLPAVVAITVLLYYDIRQRREGWDIEMALGQGAAPAAQAS
jgi:hypothetical protein